MRKWHSGQQLLWSKPSSLYSVYSLGCSHLYTIINQLLEDIIIVNSDSASFNISDDGSSTDVGLQTHTVASSLVLTWSSGHKHVVIWYFSTNLNMTLTYLIYDVLVVTELIRRIKKFHLGPQTNIRSPDSYSALILFSMPTFILLHFIRPSEVKLFHVGKVRSSADKDLNTEIFTD